MYSPYLAYKKAFIPNYTDFQQCNVKPIRQLFYISIKKFEIMQYPPIFNDI